MKKSRIVAIIPARGGSKRIPKKNIIPFCGKPLIAWTISHAKKSKKIEDVYVTTDDIEIKKISEKYGAKTIDRPKNISKDHSSSEEALKHALEMIRNEKQRPIDYVVFLQSTSPLRETTDIDRGIDTIISERADSLFSAGKLGDFYIWKADNKKMISVNYDHRKRKRGQEFGEQYVENGSFYIFRPEILFENNNRLGGKITFSLMEFWKSFEIDMKEDLMFCEELFKIKKLHKKQS